MNYIRKIADELIEYEWLFTIFLIAIAVFSTVIPVLVGIRMIVNMLGWK